MNGIIENNSTRLLGMTLSISHSLNVNRWTINYFLFCLFQVILDMSKYRKLLVRWMLKDDMKKFSVTIVPSLFLINQNGTFTKLVK